MAKISLRKKLLALEVGETMRPDKDYEEISIRSNACKLGKQTGRVYSVSKNIETRTFTVIRTA